MFSGIIEHVGHVTFISLREQAMDLRIAGGFTDLTMGESIAVNGVCLTAERFTSEGVIDFHLSGETLARTALGGLKEGQRVNLERAVALNTRLSGHIVQGHVDMIGLLHHVEEQGDSRSVRVFLPQVLRRYVVEKGSVTLNGISLTVNSLHDGCTATLKGERQAGFEIGLMIIPHTWMQTDLSSLPLGAEMNVEVDVLAKYVENLLLFSPNLAHATWPGEIMGRKTV